MSRMIVLEPQECNVPSLLRPFTVVKDFPGVPAGMIVPWDTEFHCVDCGQHIYEIVLTNIQHECRKVDSEGKDRPVLDENGEKTYYYEDSYRIYCPRCVTYKQGDRRLGEFDHKEMIVILYDSPKSPEPEQCRPLRWRSLPSPSSAPDAPVTRYRIIPAEALAELDYYREDRKKHVLSIMNQHASKAAKRRSHKARPSRARKRARYDPAFGSDYTYGIKE